MKKILILSLLTFPLFGDIKQRLEKLEKEMGEVRIETPLANFGAAYAPGGPSLREGQKGWYATGEILYWNAKVGGTEYALSSGGQSTLPFAPTKGRVKGNSFGWKYGGRVGIGKVLMHDKWDAYLNFTYYQNHNSTSTEKKPPSFLLAQVGFFGGAYERAKSTYDLTYMNLDLEIGRESFVSRTLSF
ncbi:MAG: hypothetical protein KDK60_00175, partial [Chlamydiia bacterium]|nr:hypothetical protein [Chlamydiia bacterium]